MDVSTLHILRYELLKQSVKFKKKIRTTLLIIIIVIQYLI